MYSLSKLKRGEKRKNAEGETAVSLPERRLPIHHIPPGLFISWSLKRSQAADCGDDTQW